MQRLSLAIPWTPWPSAPPKIPTRPSEQVQAGPDAAIEEQQSTPGAANKATETPMAHSLGQVEADAPPAPLAQRPRRKKRVRRYPETTQSSSTARKATNGSHKTRMRQYQLEMRTRWLYCIVYAGLLATSLIVFGSLAGMATTASTSGRIVAVVASVIFGVLFFWSVGMLFLAKAQNPESLAAHRRARSRRATSPTSVSEAEGTLRPLQPIPIVHDTADEEDNIGDEAGPSDQAQQSNGTVPNVTKPPPIYGVWRGSVRADPRLLYWQKVENNENGDVQSAAPGSPPYEEFPIYMTPSPKHQPTSFGVHPALRGIPLANLNSGGAASSSRLPRPSSADTNYPRPPVYNSSIISPRKADLPLATLSPGVYVPKTQIPYAGDERTRAALRGEKTGKGVEMGYISPNKSLGKGRPALFGEVVDV